jgi:hypothetical protein
MTLTKRQMVVARRVVVYLIMCAELGLIVASLVVGIFIGDGGP